MSLLWVSAASEYDKHYSRGYRAPYSIDRNGNSPLDRADMKGEPDSWYDGYLDNAAGREKFHSRDHTHPCEECGS